MMITKIKNNAIEGIEWAVVTIIVAAIILGLMLIPSILVAIF